MFAEDEITEGDLAEESSLQQMPEMILVGELLEAGRQGKNPSQGQCDLRALKNGHLGKVAWAWNGIVWRNPYVWIASMS